MRTFLNKSRKHKNNNRSLWVAVGLLVSVLVVVAIPALEPLAWRLTTSTFPDLGQLAKVEQEHFPRYDIRVSKSWMYAQSGTTVGYTIILKSRSIPPDRELAEAGVIACRAGLPKTTFVAVVGTKQ